MNQGGKLTYTDFGQTTTPFGRMSRPRKPWEKDEPVSEGAVEERSGFEGNLLDSSFPDPEDNANGGSEETGQQLQNV